MLAAQLDPGTSQIGTDRAVARGLQVASLACSYALPVLAAAVLLGWWWGDETLRSVHPALASMKPNTALGLMLGGAALRLAHQTSRRAIRGMRWLAAGTALLGLVTLSEYLLGWDAGIDQLLFPDPWSKVAPGRMSPVTAIMFVLLGLAQLLDTPTSRTAWQPRELLALAAGVTSLIALLGYLYGVRSLYAVGPFASVALHTALACLAYASGVLIARPELGLMRLVASDGPGGLLIRRLLPAAVMVPAFAGWLRLMGQRAGWYDTEFGLALFAASNMLCFSVLDFWTARALHGLDAVRRRAEAQVRASEESLAITLQSIGDAVIATDDRGHVTRMNPVAEQLTGLSFADALGRPLSEVFRIVQQGTRASVENPAERVLREGLVVGLANHTLLIAADGSERPIADSGAPIRDARGHVRGVVLVFRDVGEEERQARERQRSDQLLRTAYTVGRMVAWEADLETRSLRLSDNVREVLLLSEASRLERLEDALTLIHPEDRDSVEAAFLKAARGGTGQALRFRALPPGTGEMLWLEWRSVTRDAPEHGSSVRGVVIDITEAVRSEEALRLSEARYRTQFEAAPEAIVTLDVDRGTFVEANENAERLFGYDRGALSRLDPFALSPPLQADGRTSREVGRAYIERAMAGERPVFEWLHRNAAGEEIPCEIRLVRLPGDGNLCRGSVLDISERKRAEAAQDRLEETLRKTEDQLRQAQKMEAIGRLAGGVAHDFNNLLSVILGYGELILAVLPREDPIRDSLEQMARASRRAAKLTAQLLAFSRQQVLSARIIDLNQVIGELGDMLQRLIGEDIELTLALRAEGHVCVDPGQIEQVVMNLVVNARDAMPSGGQLAIETADIGLDGEYARTHLDVEPGRYVMLAVSDTGCGMDEATREHIFEPFFTTKEQGKGTGLGLSTVFGIIKQSGGNLWVYSEPGTGTTFKLYLPRAKQGSEPTRTYAPPAETLHGSETILLVEDDDQVRALARTILEKHGYQVHEAATGEDALRLCKQFDGKIDALLTDVVMPHMSGRELAQRLVLLHPATKVLFMSGYTDDAIVHHGVLSSELAFVQKPLLPEPLLARLRQVLDAEPV
jgi:two-component system cell cycle sensor histidine kinase/response regulator CckA